MSWKNITSVAAMVALLASPAFADPTFNWVDNGTSAILQIVPDTTGSLEIEVSVVADAGVGISAVNPLNTSIFEYDDNPGVNTLEGNITTLGLQTYLAGELGGEDSAFASIGSNPLAGTSAIDFLEFVFDGSAGGLTASGIIAQGGTNFNDEAVFEVATNVPGDTNGDGAVGPDDLNAVSLNWDPSGSNGPYTLAQGDLNGDGAVGPDDLNEVSLNWNPSGSAVAVPEPTSLLMVALAVIGFVTTRRS
ncbi:hypothetical protein Mal64_30170 [Pseudobythopirellula maris]|uniref:Ice-binding protein C-terminal domain-containing protein n=1 Tax=Pseudobythopirellula maris TaxID=2527991 RepID=A0A5C5ZK29_9BACT|nr:PEP-CTERM sorting domain-containing protein [Pseudobythopirellula maris]TWT87478.1 hypothetical protein Mal64_30170 [Pseudobythopirellula maris]